MYAKPDWMTGCRYVHRLHTDNRAGSNAKSLSPGRSRPPGAISRPLQAAARPPPAPQESHGLRSSGTSSGQDSQANKSESQLAMAAQHCDGPS
eukprot:scaffold12774_cov18-Prasinocladus_malaysianus.AAC.1